MNLRCDRSLIISFLSGLALYAAATLLGCPSLFAEEADVMTVQTVEGKLYAQPVKIAPVMETLEKGAKVLVLHQKGEWYAVSLPDQRLGWAHQSIFTPEKTIAKKTEPSPKTVAHEASTPTLEDESPEASAPSPAGENAILKVTSGRVRNAPSRDAGLAFGLIKGDPFTVLAKQGDWYQIRTAKGQTGWVYHTLVQFLPPAPPSVAEAPEAGEDSATTAAENAAAVKGPPSQTEDAESETEDAMASADSTLSESKAAAVETENAAASTESAPSENKKAPSEAQEPFAAADTVPPEAEKAATTADGGFTVALKVRSGRVRTGPSMSSPTAFSIPRGTRANVTETEGGWHHILLPDGRTGWSYKTMFDIVGEKDVIAPEAPEKAGAAVPAPPVVEKTAEKQTAAVKEAAAAPQSEAPAAKEIKGIRFEITPEGDENIVFELNAFNPPKTYTVDDNSVPKVVCEFADTRLSPGIGKSVPTNGKLVTALSIRQPGGGDSPIRVEASLDPRFKYSVDQVFFKKTNLYIITFKK